MIEDCTFCGKRHETNELKNPSGFTTKVCPDVPEGVLVGVDPGLPLSKLFPDGMVSYIENGERVFRNLGWQEEITHVE